MIIILIIFIVSFLLFKFSINSIERAIITYVLLIIVSSLFFNPGHDEPILKFSTINFYFNDIVVIFYIYLTFYRTFMLRKNIYLPIPLLIYLSIELIYFIISATIYGQKAFIYFKSSIFFLSPLMCFLTYMSKKNISLKIFKIFFIYVFILNFLGVIRLMGLIPIPAYYQEIISNSNFYDYNALRILNAYQVLDLVIFILIVLWLHHLYKIRLFTSILISLPSFILIIISQQRTIWFVFILLILLFIFLFFGKKQIYIVTILVLFFSFSMIVINNNEYLFNIYNNSFGEVIRNPENSTGAVRYLQAEYLFSKLNWDTTFIYGELYGADVTAQIGTVWVTFGIHMYHFSKLFFGGLFLFVPYLFFIFSILFKLMKNKKNDGENYIILLIILGNIIFNFTTSPSLFAPIYYYFAIIIGDDKLYSDLKSTI